MECFIDGRIKVFEDKFKKKPTYFNGLGAGLINGLPSFQSVETVFATANMFPMYAMIQLALYMGFSEIYLYVWDGRSRRLSRRRKGADGAGQEIRRKQRLQAVQHVRDQRTFLL